jgi:hypothetical protein
VNTKFHLADGEFRFKGTYVIVGHYWWKPKFVSIHLVEFMKQHAKKGEGHNTIMTNTDVDKRAFPD